MLLKPSETAGMLYTLLHGSGIDAEVWGRRETDFEKVTDNGQS